MDTGYRIPMTITSVLLSHLCSNHLNQLVGAFERYCITMLLLIMCYSVTYNNCDKFEIEINKL